MGTITAYCGQRIDVSDGRKGTRLLVNVTSVEVESDRLRAHFQIGDQRYAWLNRIQAGGAVSQGEGGVLTYSLYELVLSRS